MMWRIVIALMLLAGTAWAQNPNWYSAYKDTAYCIYSFPSSGTAITDSSTNNADATLNCPVYTTRGTANAVHITNAAGGAVKCWLMTDDKLIKHSHSYTVAYWVNVTAFPATNKYSWVAADIFLENGVASATNYVWQQLISGPGGNRIYGNTWFENSSVSGYIPPSSLGQLNAGQWYHVAWAIDDDANMFYHWRDGVCIYTNAYTNTPPTEINRSLRMLIGGFGAGGSDAFCGQISDFIVGPLWSIADMTNMYAQTSTNWTAPPSASDGSRNAAAALLLLQSRR